MYSQINTTLISVLTAIFAISRITYQISTFSCIQCEQASTERNILRCVNDIDFQQNYTHTNNAESHYY